MATPLANRWCYTWNNPTEPPGFICEEDKLYEICGKEHFGAADGTPHYQGYIEFPKRLRLATLKKRYGNKISWRIAKGTAAQNKTYCSKEDPAPYEYGAPQAYEDKHARFMLLAKDRNYAAILEEDPAYYVRHNSAIKSASGMLASKPIALTWEEGNSPNLWITGLPGTGKSWYADHHFGEEDTYAIKPLAKWWPGYAGQATIHIEDVELSQGKEILGILKHYGDKKAFMIEDKGTTAWIRPQRIIVTSNHGMEHMGWQYDDYLALQRRFKQITFDQSMRDGI